MYKKTLNLVKAQPFVTISLVNAGRSNALY